MPSIRVARIEELGFALRVWIATESNKVFKLVSAMLLVTQNAIDLEQWLASSRVISRIRPFILVTPRWKCCRSTLILLEV